MENASFGFKCGLLQDFSFKNISVILFDSVLLYFLPFSMIPLTFYIMRIIFHILFSLFYKFSDPK